MSAPVLPAQTIQRVCHEVRDVNNDFHSLRTLIQPTERVDEFSFVLFPNYGALSHLPLIGELIIPPTYPAYPPVLHLFTTTHRYNVDVYSSNKNDKTHSTMCFDILRSEEHGGTWEKEFTLTCLFASLMQALVSVLVPQEYGGEHPEYVSMEKMESIKNGTRATYEAHKWKIPVLPEIPQVAATIVEKAEPLIFSDINQSAGQRGPLMSLSFDGKENIYVSQPIYLQEKPFCCSVQLDLNNLHPFVVFSVILSNNRGTDLFGKQHDTVLVRNGVTGTAARKRKGDAMVWYYHGKPLNEKNLSVAITVTHEQFTMAYPADKAGRETYVVHGDTAISKLDRDAIGNVSGQPFYVSIYLKRKSGSGGAIDILDYTKKGYIHDVTPISAAESLSTIDSLTHQFATQTLANIPPVSAIRTPLFVKLLLSSEATSRLAGLLDFYMLGTDFPVKRNIQQPAHQTLIYHRDYAKSEYEKIISSIYLPLENKVRSVVVTSIVADAHCVCYLTEPPVGIDAVGFLPNKIFHITMRLRGKPPAYSNQLALRILAKRARGEELRKDENFTELPDKIRLEDCVLKFHYP